MLNVEKRHLENDFYREGDWRNKKLRVVVIHYDVFDNIDQSLSYFVNHVDKDPDTSASYNYLVDEERIIELVDPIKNRAWHAGKSQIVLPDGTALSSLNQSSVGICVRNKGWSETKTDLCSVRAPGSAGGAWLWWEPYSFKAIENVARIIADIEEKISRPFDATVAHSDVSLSGKVDPGPLFPWSDLWILLQKYRFPQ